MCASATLAEPPARYRRVDSTTLRYESTYTGCRHDHPPQPVNVFFFRVVRFSLHDPWDRANRRDLILSLLRSTDSYELQFDGYLSIISVLSYLSIPSQRFRTTSCNFRRIRVYHFGEHFYVIRRSRKNRSYATCIFFLNGTAFDPHPRAKRDEQNDGLV